jgi:hypothetical protein
VRARLGQTGERTTGGVRRWGVLAGAFLAAIPVSARANERITDFSSAIRVAQTGALTITETISVNAEGYAIRHGIFRDFPTVYADKDGRRVHVGFDVLSVALDGQDEPYSVAAIPGGERVRIGDPKAVLPPGPHRFTLTYATDRQIRFFTDYDELYWNVTGNFWAFPIDQAEAVVELPRGAQIAQFAAYTGAAGAVAQNAQGEKISDSAIRFSTTAPLGPQEGLTIAVGFSKGAVLPPSPEELRRDFLRDNAAAITAMAGVLLMLVYFAAVGMEVAGQPPRGTIVPLFAPPRDFSPAAVRFVHRMGYDRKAYAASLVDMAVKGYLKIAQCDDAYTLTRTGRSEAEAGLAHGEAAIAAKLFEDGDAILLKQVNHEAISRSISALKISLASEYERVYFVTNLHWFLGGMAMFALTAFASGVLCDDPRAGGCIVWIAGACFATAVLLQRTWEAWVGMAGPGSRLANGWRAFVLSGLSVPFALAWMVGLFRLQRSVPLPVTMALSIGAIAAYAFYHLLKHPTLLGAKIFDEIDGFKLFLVTAEKDRLEALNPPNVTPELFEKFLPYAIALDCETQWSRKFEAEAEAAGLAQGAAGGHYTPGWYSGGAFEGFGAAGFAAGLGASMASAAATASGSGGGGASGGGGGGGGGGGW